MALSKVVSTHLWSTPRATFTNRLQRDSFHSGRFGDCLGCALGVYCNFLGLWLEMDLDFSDLQWKRSI